jgi:hypothetical protein
MPFLIRCLTWALECAVREGYAFFISINKMVQRTKMSTFSTKKFYEIGQIHSNELVRR